MDCCLYMIDVHEIICNKLKIDSLPSVDYRISVDYGQAVIMKSGDNIVDLWGPPVNMCSKINRLATCNGIAIGGNLYQIVKHMRSYKLSPIQGFPVCFKSEYPVYCLKDKLGQEY
ncbi:MAG: hypothetical protein GWN01_06510 [Nitrosopumilaceae archaeon]|nr:hypothetical protein [Nitrosopumilaceae archaeon]NIU00589.1 hypothetical protein [Nitrosopumilaceae archaeon]NIU86975.1 hypothetical protein [Nitrosopumilaceae archaeon]NIV66439.1 hypothetical protein [Nitrosopumilaceae archaeon]NIX61191.1 hypothetical protein [Nitrosopumilaceae archaeon]